MPTSAELLDAQYEFELPRGLLIYNRGAKGLSRMLEEAGEAIDDFEAGKLPEMMIELCDVIIFAHSILGWLARETGTPYEGIDRMIEQKMERNSEKYALRFFDGVSTEEGLRQAREEWNGKNQTPN